MVQSIRKIGNSSGIILPKSILEQVGIEEKVDLEIVGNSIVLKSHKAHPRAGWQEAFEAAATQGDVPENDLFDGLSNEFDKTEWQW